MSIFDVINRNIAKFTSKATSGAFDKLKAQPTSLAIKAQPSPLIMTQEEISKRISASIQRAKSITTPLTTIKGIAQEIAKSTGSIGLALTGKKELRIDPSAPKWQQAIQRNIFGTEPVESFGTRVEKFPERAAEFGIPESISKAAAPWAVGLITTLDLTGLGGEKNVVRILARSKSVSFITKTLKQIGVADDIVIPAAQKISKITDEKEIKIAIDRISELQKTTKHVKPLAQEARKYKSAEEFSKAWDIDGMRGRYWHITDSPNFKISKDISPKDATSIGMGQKGGEGLIVSSVPSQWLPYARNRKYISEIDLSKAKPNVDYTIVNRGFGQEVFIKNLDAVSVKSTKPIKQGMADVRNWEKAGFKNKEEAIDFYTQVTKGVEKVVAKKKPSGIALSIEAKSIEKELTKEFKGLAEFTPTTIKKQAKKMAQEMKDIENVKSMVRGDVALSEGLSPSTVITTMEKYAYKNKDGELMAELAKSPLLSKISIGAQDLSLMSQREKESAVTQIKSVIKTREKGVERKLKFKTPEKIKSTITKSLEKEIKKTKPTKYSWQKLMDDIQC